MNLRTGMLVLLGLFVGAATSSAQEINARRHLNPAVQVKVNKVMARAMREQGTGKQAQGRSGSGSNCGNLVVGDGGNGENSRNDVTIVADFIININKNCR